MAYKQPSSGLPFKELGSSPVKEKPKKKLKQKIQDELKNIKTQGFSNIDVKGINWGKEVPELKGTESRQGVNVSGINLSRDFKLNKNLNLSLSNPAIVHARPTIDGSFASKFGKTKVLPFEPRISLTYNIPSRKRK
jgi:hypothetical protein